MMNKTLSVSPSSTESNTPSILTRSAFVALGLAMACLAMACGQQGAPAGEPASPTVAAEPASASPDGDATLDETEDPTDDVAYEPAYPEDVSEADLTTEDTSQQQSTHSHGDGEEHSHEEGEGHEGEPDQGHEHD